MQRDTEGGQRRGQRAVTESDEMGSEGVMRGEEVWSDGEEDGPSIPRGEERAVSPFPPSPSFPSPTGPAAPPHCPSRSAEVRVRRRHSQTATLWRCSVRTAETSERSYTPPSLFTAGWDSEDISTFQPSTFDSCCRTPTKWREGTTGTVQRERAMQAYSVRASGLTCPLL